jgi:predicted acyltransferase
MAGVFAKTLGRIIKWQTSVLQDDGTFKEITTNASSWIYQNCCVPLLGNNEWGSLLYALGYVTIFTTMAIILYKKKIVIKL